VFVGVSIVDIIIDVVTAAHVQGIAVVTVFDFVISAADIGE